MSNFAEQVRLDSGNFALSVIYYDLDSSIKCNFWWLQSIQTLDKHNASWQNLRKALKILLDEFTFRFNRKSTNQRGNFFRFIQNIVATNPTPIDELTKEINTNV